MEERNEFFQGNPRFDVILDERKDQILQERKANNTNRSTKQWVNAFSDYLKERQLPKVEDLETEQLPEIIGDFYFSARKQPKKNRLSLKKKENSDDDPNDKYYKNSTLKNARAALNRYFKERETSTSLQMKSL